MNSITIYLIKPPAPAVVRKGKCLLEEENRYEWEPLGLELIAYRLREKYGDRVSCTLWHIRDEKGVRELLNTCRINPPDLAVFSEIDVYVNGASAIATRLKRLVPTCLTVVGGKHSSLLRVGDRIPFRGMDMVIAGCGVAPLIRICENLPTNKVPEWVPGHVRAGDDGRVISIVPLAPRDDLRGVDGRRLRELEVMGVDREDYFGRFQRFASPAEAPQRTASLLWSTGCPWSCGFCQSPLERDRGPAVIQRPIADLADEMEWLYRSKKVNSFFAVAANLDLESLLAVYVELDTRGIRGLPVAGFVRAADVAGAWDSGLLGKLASFGSGVLSVGYDLSPITGEDRFGKGFSMTVMDKCLQAGLACGVPLSLTLIGDSRLSKDDFCRTLDAVVDLPVHSVDVRMITAFRNTRFYHENKDFLAGDPDDYPSELDLNNYRRQTLRVPGGITDAESGEAVRRFKKAFAASPARHRYAAALLEKRPDLAGLFKLKYAELLLSPPVDPDAAETCGLLFGGNPSRTHTGGHAYDSLADAYDRVFADIRVRAAEWNWIRKKLGEQGHKVRLLELGCGTGAVLRAVAPFISSGIGVDISPAMLAKARARDARERATKTGPMPPVEYVLVDGPSLPFQDNSFDMVISFLSYRYLDWEHIPSEILRVLKTGGRFLCVDMVAQKASVGELPGVILDGLRSALMRLRKPSFARSLHTMVSMSEWKEMQTKHNPKPCALLTSHVKSFYHANIEVINRGKRHRVVAFEAVKNKEGIW